MSSKIAKYLRQHISGEIVTSVTERQYFSRDASIFEVIPEYIIHPTGSDDVRKLMRLSWQLAEKGKVLPITARGSGTDRSGAAIGGGIILNLPTHVNKLLELDTGKNYCRVQPGMNFGALQTTLLTHGKFIPAFPASGDYSTIGGAIANNAAGPKTVKYGPIGTYVSELKVVLSNGEMITTKPLSKHELSRKKGLTNFEGEVYRQIDGIISDNTDLIKQTHLDITKNVAGYNVADVRRKGGGIDLTPLFIGAQGTLGVIVEAKLKIAKHQPKSVMALALFENRQTATDVVPSIIKLKPSMLELVDGSIIEKVVENHPRAMYKALGDTMPGAVLLVEFDDSAARDRQRKSKQLAKLLKQSAIELKLTDLPEEQSDFWQVRRAVAQLPKETRSHEVPVPFLSDAVISPDKLNQAFDFLEGLARRHSLTLPTFAHAGDGHIQVQPMLDLSRVGDRQKLFKMGDEYYKFIIEQGGSTTGQMGDGRLRAPYLQNLYGEDVYKLFKMIKKAFDPHGILNPGVKLDVSREDLVKLISSDRAPVHFSHYLPYF